MKLEDYLPKDLVNEIAKMMAAGIKKGAKEGFTAGNFLGDLQDQMDQFAKDQQAYLINEKVKQRSLDKTLDVREIELDVLKETAIEQNKSIIQDLKALAVTQKRAIVYAQLQGNMQAFYQALFDLDETEKQIGSLHKQNNLLEIATKERKKQLKIQIDQEKQQKLEEQRSEKIKELEEKRKEILDKIGVNTSLIKDFLQGGVARTLAITIAAEKMGEAFGEAFKELQGEGLSATQAAHEAMTSFTDSMKTGFLASSEEIRKARAAVMETGGTLHDAEEAGKGAAMMAKVYGGSLEDAGKAIGNLQKIPGVMKESAQSTAEFGAKLSIAAGVPADTATKAIANNMDAVAKAGPTMVKSFQVAAINAKKIGVEFSVITGMADKLLDFENSINAQMEASVMLGKQINLDKAREAALNGDYLTVQKEILKQVGSEAEFTRMNVLQKQKLAEAIGVSVPDLAKMVKGQGELSDGTKLEAEARSKVSEGLETSVAFMSKYSGAVGALVGGVISAIPQFMTFNAMKKLNSTLTGENTISQNTNSGAINRNSLSMQRAGLMAKGAATSMLAFGGAVLMIGGGIALATLGIAQLAEAMKGLSLPEFIGLAAILIGIGVGIYFLATATATAAPLLFTGGTALLYFGGGLALIGLGIGIAAAGMALFVNSIGNLANEEVVKNLYGVGGGLFYIAKALGAVALGSVAVPTLGVIKSLGLSGIGEQEPLSGIGEQEPKTEEGQFSVLQKGVDDLNSTMIEIKKIISKGSKVVIDSKVLGEIIANQMQLKTS
jgi:hypothetical protein